MALKAKSTEVVKAQKPKVLLFGDAGKGKTHFLTEADKHYYFDIEGGATQPQYREKLKKAKAAYFGKDEGSQDFGAVVNEVKALATEEHSYQVMSLDSYSKLYNMAIAVDEAKGASVDFGKNKQGANKATRQLQTWLERIDMTVFLVCHSKEKWAGGAVVGKTFDGFAKLEYDLDLSLEVTRVNGVTRAKVHKTRLNGFPEGAEFELTWAEFVKRAGAVIERKAEVFKSATEEQVSKVKNLMEKAKVGEDWQDKAFAKEGVTTWDEMHGDRVQAAIDALSKAIEGVK